MLAARYRPSLHRYLHPTPDPADDFEFPEDIEFAREGGWHWFQARVTVAFCDDSNPKNWATPRERVLGEDYLGGCSYHGLKDFRESGTLASMISEAISEARGTLARMCCRTPMPGEAESEVVG